MAKALVNPARESLKKIGSIKRLSFLVCLAVKVNVSKRITNAQGRKRYTTEFVEEGYALQKRTSGGAGRGVHRVFVLRLRRFLVSLMPSAQGRQE